MSRLFESFGDDADEAAFPIVPLPEPDAIGESMLGDIETSLLDDAAYSDAHVHAEPERPAGHVEAEPPISLLSIDYEIPDFERDARELAAYEDAKKRHIRQAISNGETAIHASFKAKRELLVTEIRASRSFEDERRASAMHTTREYANAYPLRVDKKGVNPPGFWENIFSFGRAGRLYRAASIATEALETLRNGMRKREEQLNALESQMSRALYLKEEAVKKTLESDAGIAEFHERPEIAGLFARVEKINKERADYAKRLEIGAVSGDEERDRAMAEHNLEYAALPMMGVIIAKVARFGHLSYFQLRNLEMKESLLSYDPRLDPLRNSVFDVYSVAGAVAAKLKRNDNGTAFRVADHFKACWRNGDQAEELYSQHRSALREERGLPTMPPRDATEAEIIERLAALAAVVDGGGNARDTQQAVTGGPPARS